MTDKHSRDNVPLLEPYSQEETHTPLDTVFFLAKLLVYLYLFLAGIELLSSGFKLLSGGAMGGLFASIRNPLLGLMIGMSATALLQSSSTTTSIIVGLVASGSLTVPTAIPMIMGANIGTSVTNTFVSLGHVGSREEFERAFAGATVHDLFNILSVMVLLPLEILFGVIQKLSGWMTSLFVGSTSTHFKSPFKLLLQPFTSALVQVDKAKIKAASLGESIKGSLIKGGFFSGTGFSDNMVGLTIVFLSALLTVIALLAIVRLMKQRLGAKAGAMLNRALEKNAYVSMGLGAGATAIVQSSSITTSTFVPLVGVGLVSLEAIYPLTLGANIGTTITALLASMGGGASAGLQIALCHLLFNILGILLWYPVPFLRNIPLALARWLGKRASERRILALLYIGTVFFALPLGLLLLSRLF